MINKIILRLSALIWRVFRKLNKEIIHIVMPFVLDNKVAGHIELDRLGSAYGGWNIPSNSVNSGSVCYCVGVGVDATFDLELVKQFQCMVYSFDPTPQAVKYMSSLDYDNSKLLYSKIGVWNKDTSLKFYEPANPAHTSHSVYDLHGTNKYIEVECKTLSTIMKSNGHKKIDLLKLDIEGAWSQVLDNAVDDDLSIGVLCVELDSPVNLLKVFKLLKKMKILGLSLVHVEKDNYLFITGQ